MDKETEIRLQQVWTDKRPITLAEVYCYLKMPKEIPVRGCESSNVKAYGFDSESKVLKVVFINGTEYRYLNVFLSVAGDLDKAESKGKMLAIIKNHFRAVKIDAGFYEGGNAAEQAEEKAVKKELGGGSVSPCSGCGNFVCLLFGSGIEACGPQNSFEHFHVKKERPATT